MKTFYFAFCLSTIIALSSTSAQTTSGAAAANSNRPAIGASARDGFTLRGAEVVMTRDGVTAKVERSLAFSNGLKVSASGNITMPDGSSTALRPNQLLTFDGNLHDVVLTPDGVAPLSSVDTGPAPKIVKSVSTRDGITISGSTALLTRGGVTRKVTDDVRLPNGVTAKSDGSVIMGNGNTITLRPDQLLDLNGILHDGAIRPAGTGPARRR
jgi:hypothetical protein